jgi:hypothetical protein
MATEGAGAARDLGQGWKISPSVKIKPKQVTVFAFDNRCRSPRPLVIPNPVYGVENG